MSINASYEYLNAEKLYAQAQTLEQRIAALEEMIRVCPGHKGAENLRAELRSRLKKLREKHEKSKRIGRTSQKAIKKEGFQCAIIGLPNAGKSSLLTSLTNAHPRISPVPFTTQEPEIGTLDIEGVKAQLIDLPAIGSEAFDIGIVNTADCVLIVLSSLDDLEKILPSLTRSSGKRLIALNKTDLLTDDEARKLNERIKSRKLNAVLISCSTGFGIPELKEQIMKIMSVIRVYTKEPGKSPSSIPIVLPVGSSVAHVAESILKGFSQRVKETRLTGPSSKFPNQRVGLSHILQDKDIVEFHTR